MPMPGLSGAMAHLWQAASGDRGGAWPWPAGLSRAMAAGKRGVRGARRGWAWPKGCAAAVRRGAAGLQAREAAGPQTCMFITSV